jgi:hypothetical protein
MMDAAPMPLCAQMHALCDDFDKPNEMAGQSPPWTTRAGTLQIADGFNSTKGLEARAMFPGSVVYWALPTAMSGIDCSGMVYFEPAMDRSRGIAGLSLDMPNDAGGTSTTYLGVAVNDNTGASGLVLGPGVDVWAATNTPPPTKTWLPFKFTAARNGLQVSLSATIGSIVLTGMRTLPVMNISGGISFGASALSSGPTGGDIVRWDNIICDLLK